MLKIVLLGCETVTTPTFQLGSTSTTPGGDKIKKKKTLRKNLEKTSENAC